jgi:hypothetical protein
MITTTSYPHSVSGRVRRIIVPVLLLMVPICVGAQQQAVGKAPQLPAPFETIKDKKEFNAVQFGPGNTFTIMQTPPDFHLAAFAISADGNQLAMGWESARIELWDLHTKKKLREFKSDLGPPGVVRFDDEGKQLIITGPKGQIAFFSLSNGKKSKGWTIPLGKNNYDLHEVVRDPNGRWLAYADEESSKVLDMTEEPPKLIADLRDAGSIALSQDGSKLWTVNRSELVGFNTKSWEVIGHWPIKAPAINTSPVLVRTGITSEGKRTVAVPSIKGLAIYTEPEMSSEFVTDKPTSAVGFAGGRDLYINVSGEITFLSATGRSLCKRSYKGRVNYAVSEDGQWFAISQFNSVDLWRMEDLLRDCAAGQ